MNILGIESSCDETAASVVENGRTIRSNVVLSQVDIHAVYGGVVPEIASRKHLETVCALAERAVNEAGISKRDLAAIAVTNRPGLIGALLTGVSFAKAAARALGIPIVPVNHIYGHVAAAYVAYPLLKPPFACLAASGGNTRFLRVNDYTDVTTLGATRDDAAGEAFDKAARVMGIPYPGGREIDRLAGIGREKYGAGRCMEMFPLPRPGFADAPFDTSFSGLKTAVVNLAHHAEQTGAGLDREALSASFCEAVSDILVPRAVRAMNESGVKKLVVCGGVAANTRLRARLTDALGGKDELFLVPLAMCGDNGAMIAAQGYYEFIAGRRAGLDLNAYASA